MEPEKLDPEKPSRTLDIGKEAAYGHEEDLKHALDQGVDPNTGGAIVAAAANGWDKCVSMLIDAKADVNAVGPDGYTALEGATKFGNTECVEILVKAGASNDLLIKAAR